MKNKILAFCVLGLALFSCKKDDETYPDYPPTPKAFLPQQIMYSTPHMEGLRLSMVETFTYDTYNSIKTHTVDDHLNGMRTEYTYIYNYASNLIRVNGVVFNHVIDTGPIEDDLDIWPQVLHLTGRKNTSGKAFSNEEEAVETFETTVTTSANNRNIEYNTVWSSGTVVTESCTLDSNRIIFVSKVINVPDMSPRVEIRAEDAVIDYFYSGIFKDNVRFIKSTNRTDGAVTSFTYSYESEKYPKGVSHPFSGVNMPNTSAWYILGGINTAINSVFEVFKEENRGSSTDYTMDYTILDMSTAEINRWGYIPKTIAVKDPNGYKGNTPELLVQIEYTRAR